MWPRCCARTWTRIFHICERSVIGQQFNRIGVSECFCVGRSGRVRSGWLSWMSAQRWLRSRRTGSRRETLSWHNITDGFPIIGPKFEGMSEEQGLTLWFYTFPTFELFKEWALGAPEHVAIHTGVLEALRVQAGAAGADVLRPAGVLPSYSFHATDAPREQIPAIRAELREMYKQIEAAEWAGVPAGTVQLMMLGDH